MRHGKTPARNWRLYFDRHTALGRFSWQLTINSSMTTGMTLTAGDVGGMLWVCLGALAATLYLHRGRAGMPELVGVGMLLGFYWEGWALYFGLLSYPYTDVLPPHVGPMWGVIAAMAVCIYGLFQDTKPKA